MDYESPGGHAEGGPDGDSPHGSIYKGKKASKSLDKSGAEDKQM